MKASRPLLPRRSPRTQKAKGPHVSPPPHPDWDLSVLVRRGEPLVFRTSDVQTEVREDRAHDVTSHLPRTSHASFSFSSFIPGS